MAAKTDKTTLTVKTTVKAPVEKVWTFWTDPRHIIRWNFAANEWHSPWAENDVRVGGNFSWRMEARDGSMGFDFNGKYTKVELHKLLEYTLGDNRKVQISFVPKGNETSVTETFEAEHENSLELQQGGWQAILNNFSKHAEAAAKNELMCFDITIQAPVEKVYKTMFDENTYKEWAAVFNPTSHFKGSWAKGSKIVFLGTDQNGEIGGMTSRIKENIPNKFVSIEHLGMIMGNNEITSGPEVDDWAGALENYTFTSKGSATILLVDMDSNEEFKEYFIDTWPKALKKLKEICEK